MAMPLPRAILESFTITSMAPGGQDFKTFTLAGEVKPMSSRCLVIPCPPRISKHCAFSAFGKEGQGQAATGDRSFAVHVASISRNTFIASLLLKARL